MPGTMRLSALSLATALLLGTSCSRAPSPAEPHVLAGSRPSLRTVFESFPVGGAGAVTPLYENGDAWAARWRVIEDAEHTIDVSYFILDADVFGLSFLGLLLAKADAGVRVRLLVDSLGTVALSDPALDRDVLAYLDNHPNIEVRVYNPLTGSLRDVLEEASLLPLAASNHDKIILADGTRGIVGGRNIADEYFNSPGRFAKAYDDADLLLESRRGLAGLERAFEREFADGSAKSPSADSDDAERVLQELRLVAFAMDAWLAAPPLLPREVAELAAGAPVRERIVRELVDDASRALGASPTTQSQQTIREIINHPHLRGASRTAPPSPARGELRILDSCSQAGCERRRINEQLVRVVASAEHSIIIENPYVMFTADVIDALEAAGKRGVKIALLTNSARSSDDALAQAIFLEQWPLLLERVPGMRIFVLGGRHNMHAKVAVIDDQLTLVGSYNLDFLSAALNGEIIAAAWSRGLARRTRAHVLAKLERPDVYEYRLARDASGRAIRRDGELVVAFGAADHLELDDYERLGAIRKALRFVGGAFDWLIPLRD